jgi:hypothetical protein
MGPQPIYSARHAIMIHATMGIASQAQLEYAEGAMGTPYLQNSPSGSPERCEHPGRNISSPVPRVEQPVASSRRQAVNVSNE